MAAGSIVIDLLAKTGSFETDVGRAEKRLKSLGKQSKDTSVLIGVASSSLAKLAGVVAGSLSFRAITEYADAWTGLENRIRLVTSTQGELASSVDDVYQISKRTNQEIDSSAQIYQRFAQNAGALGITLEDVAGLTDTVAKAVAISGASASSAEASLTQFGQSLASGVFRGQEFNSVMEQTPGLAMAIARGFGVTIGELRRMANDGELTADRLVVALQKAKDSVDEQFNTRVKTVAMSFTNLQTTVTRYIGESNNALGGTQALGGAIDYVSDVIEGLRGNTDTLANDLVTLGAAFDAVVFSVTETYEAANEFGRQFQEMLGATGDSTVELGDLITTSFTQSFLATAKELDALWDAFDGTARALEAIFDAATYNIQVAFENVFNAIREMVSEAVNHIATNLNELPGIDIDTSIWVGPGQMAFKSLSDSAKDAYAQGGKTLSLYDDLTKRLANSAIERSLAAEGYTTGVDGVTGRPGAVGGSGGGGGGGGAKKDKTKKPERNYIASNLDEMLLRMGEADEWLDAYEIKTDKTFDKVGEFALEAARNIQSSLGDGLYDILSGNFDNIGSKFGDMILRMAADAAAANLAGALFGDYDKNGKIGGIIGNIASSLFGGSAPIDSVSPGFNLNAQSYFDSGGFTGHGGKYEPAGIVHRGEVVFSQDDVRRNGGVSRVESMRLRGYSGGGVVGGGSIGANQPVSVVINNNGQKMEMTQQPKVSFDSVRGLIIEVFTGDNRVNGPMTRSMRGAL